MSSEVASATMKRTVPFTPEVGGPSAAKAKLSKATLPEENQPTPPPPGFTPAPLAESTQESWTGYHKCVWCSQYYKRYDICNSCWTELKAGRVPGRSCMQFFWIQFCAARSIDVHDGFDGGRVVIFGFNGCSARGRSRREWSSCRSRRRSEAAYRHIWGDSLI